jgi:spore coat polysaccharide biosynthesis protein SpsF
MIKKFNNSQEEFWANEFGDNYIDRNSNKEYLASNIVFFSKIFSQQQIKIKSILELGCNIGMNLLALKEIFPNLNVNGIDINEKAIEQLQKFQKNFNLKCTSINNFKTEEKFDLVLSKGVLIHLNPNDLNETYEKIYNLSKKYILICEYYNPTPCSIPYRGHNDRLFKRDFAGEILNKYPDLKLVNYGFSYHGDIFSQDDITWFLIKK